MFTFALEGPDRLGKTTQAALLREAFAKGNLGFRACVVKIPYKGSIEGDATDLGTYDKIYSMLFSGLAVKKPVLFQSLQAFNRLLWQELEKEKYEDQYDVVVFDRWNLSTKVYGQAAGIPRENTEALIYNLQSADRTYIFEGDPFQRGGEDDYEKDVEFQRKIRDGYAGYLKDPVASLRLVSVNANRDEQVIHQEILSNICSYVESKHKIPMKGR